MSSPKISALMISLPKIASKQNVPAAGNKDAGTTGLAPNALVATAGRGVVVVAGEKLAFVNPELTVQQMQLFYAGMSMRRIVRAGREPHQHAEPVPFRVGCEHLAFDAGRHLFPFRFRPLWRRRWH